VIALRKEEAGVLVMELSEHLWPEDLDSAISTVHDVARSRQNPLLLLVEVASDFDTSTWDVLRQILQPGILAQNRPSRIAVLKKTDEERDAEIPSGQICTKDLSWSSHLCRLGPRSLARPARIMERFRLTNRMVGWGGWLVRRNR
jgi:hypothetical protein